MTHTTVRRTSRRRFMGSAAAVVAAPLALRSEARAADSGDTFTFEVTRTPAEWRSRLSEEEYKVLRLGGTEPPRSDPMWESTEAGRYACKGCALEVYDARWKVVLDIGWLFFRHAQPNAVLTGIDRSLYDQFSGPDTMDMTIMVPMAEPVESLSLEQLEALEDLIAIEVHCRRCGSHFGHVIHAAGKILHCVNGAALEFGPVPGK